MDSTDTKKTASVKSPSNSIEGVNSNCGGTPPTWDVKKIFDEATPPPIMAKNSTDGLGNLSN